MREGRGEEPSSRENCCWADSLKFTPQAEGGTLNIRFASEQWRGTENFALISHEFFFFFLLEKWHAT